MVKRWLSVLHKEISGLHEAAYLLAVFAFLSQVLALIRDRLLAHYFGASRALDLYYAAFRIPDLIFVSVASLVSIAVLVPFLAEHMEKGNDQEKQFINQVFTLFFGLIVAVDIVAFFLVPKLSPHLLPGFNGNEQTQLISLTRLLLLSPLFLGISNFLASITQIYRRFTLYALSPILYNLGIIAGIMLLYPRFGLFGLGLGVVIGAAVHFFVQVPFVSSKHLLPKLNLKIHWPSIKKVVLLSLPRTLTMSSNQLATFFLIALASLMSKGSIAIFNFSYNLQSVPLSIIGISYSSAAFPTLSRMISKGDHSRFVEHMITGARHVIFWSTPVMVLFIVLRAQIVRVILGSGQFNWNDTRLTAACFAMFTFSVIAQSLILLFVRAYYAQGKTLKPMLINLCSMALVVAIAYISVKLFYLYPYFKFFLESLFKIDDIPGSVVLVLPFAFSIGVLINTFWHWFAFGIEYKQFNKPVLATLFEVLTASIIMGYVTYTSLAVFSNIFNLDTFWGILGQGFFAGCVGIISFIVLLLLLKNKEIQEIWKALHAKIWKVDVIVPETMEQL